MTDSCEGRQLGRPCQRGGYQDPNNCTQCRCPDGFEGQYCNILAVSVKGLCTNVQLVGLYSAWST